MPLVCHAVEIKLRFIRFHRIAREQRMTLSFSFCSFLLYISATSISTAIFIFIPRRDGIFRLSLVLCVSLSHSILSSYKICIRNLYCRNYRHTMSREKKSKVQASFFLREKKVYRYKARDDIVKREFLNLVDKSKCATSLLASRPNGDAGKLGHLAFISVCNFAMIVPSNFSIAHNIIYD